MYISTNECAVCLVTRDPSKLYRHQPRKGAEHVFACDECIQDLFRRVHGVNTAFENSLNCPICRGPLSIQCSLIEGNQHIFKTVEINEVLRRLLKGVLMWQGKVCDEKDYNCKRVCERVCGLFVQAHRLISTENEEDQNIKKAYCVLKDVFHGLRADSKTLTAEIGALLNWDIREIGTIPPLLDLDLRHPLPGENSIIHPVGKIFSERISAEPFAKKIERMCLGLILGFLISDYIHQKLSHRTIEIPKTRFTWTFKSVLILDVASLSLFSVMNFLLLLFEWGYRKDTEEICRRIIETSPLDWQKFTDEALFGIESDEELEKKKTQFLNSIEKFPRSLGNRVSYMFCIEDSNFVFAELTHNVAMGFFARIIVQKVEIRFNLNLRVKPLNPVVGRVALVLGAKQGLYFRSIYRELLDIQKIQEILYYLDTT